MVRGAVAAPFSTIMPFSEMSDVVDEMVEAYDMGTLLDIRNKMFENAKKKLLNSVSEPGNKDLDPDFRWFCNARIA